MYPIVLLAPPSGVKRRMNGVLPLADLFLLGNIEIIPRIPIQRWGLVVNRQKVIKNQLTDLPSK